MYSQEKFHRFINEESDIFPIICKMMLHSQIENGRRFLCAMNNVVNYCFAQKKHNESGADYHIIYLPTCPEWARELLVRFFIHKVAFSSPHDLISIAKRKTTEPLYLKSDITKKETKRLFEERKYLKKFLSLIEGKVSEDAALGKSLFVLQEKDINTRKQDMNPWLKQLYTNNIFDSRRNVVITTSATAHDIETAIRKRREETPVIESLFIFHSMNRGRITYSYNKDQIERLNQYDVGIKNCLIFYISEKPYRLYHAQDNIKYLLSSYFLNREIKKFNDFDGFITFTPNELDQMFNRKNNNSLYVIDSPEREIFTSDVDSYFDEFSYNYKIKNALSLAITEEVQDTFLDYCRQEIGVSQDRILLPFLSFYRQLWNNEIRGNIEKKLMNYKSIAFILPRWVSQEYKTTIKRCFSTDERRIFIANFEDLKEGVNAEVVVMFTYRYTNSKYKTYPNSFDPLPLKNNQHGLTIINRLTHNRYYEWNKYFYDKSYNGLLFSDFRKDTLVWSKRVYQRPVLPGIFENIDEAEADARDYMVEKCTLNFEGGKIKCLAASRALYSDGTKFYISNLKELPFEEGMEIQLMDEIIDQIKESLINKTDKSLKSEEYIRRDPEYKLSEEQIVSDIELWKYLLKRKVDSSNIEETYRAIFPSSKEISLRGFERWLDLDYPMILPRSRKSQNSLLTYLGFDLGSPYHRVILTKKLMKNSNTRILNSQIESLLQSIMTVPSVREEDFNNLFEEHSEILTLLEVNSAAETNILVELLDIKFKKLISIKYDSDKA